MTIKYLFLPIQDFPSVATFFPLGHVQTPPSRELLQSCSQLSEVHNVVAAIKMVKINAILTPLEKLRVSWNYCSHGILQPLQKHIKKQRRQTIIEKAAVILN